MSHDDKNFLLAIQVKLSNVMYEGWSELIEARYLDVKHLQNFSKVIDCIDNILLVIPKSYPDTINQLNKFKNAIL